MQKFHEMPQFLGNQCEMPLRTPSFCSIPEQKCQARDMFPRAEDVITRQGMMSEESARVDIFLKNKWLVAWWNGKNEVPLHRFSRNRCLGRVT